MEEWRDIKGFEGYYQVSSFGRVRSLERETLVKNVKRKNGERADEIWLRSSRLLKPVSGGYVHLYRESQARVNINIKRLVAQAFLPDYNENITSQSIRLVDPAKGWRVDNMYIELHKCKH